MYLLYGDETWAAAQGPTKRALQVEWRYLPLSRDCKHAAPLYSNMNKCSVTELQKLKILDTTFFYIFTLFLVNSLLS